jgi:hypothetical protein
MGEASPAYRAGSRSNLPQEPLTRFHPAYGWVLLLWLALGIAVSVRTVVSPEKHTVFPIFAASAAHWWEDQPLYARYPQLDDYFRYPPVFAVAATPFSLLGPVAGGILWSWVSLAVYGAGLWFFARDVISVAWTPQRTAAFLALGALGAVRGLWNAQSNALVVGLMLLAASALLRRRWWTAALLLAGSVLIKLTPLAPALLLCALWPRRLIGRFALALVLGFLVPFLTRSPGVVVGHYQEWLGHLANSGSERWPGFRDGWTAWIALRQQVKFADGPLPLREPIDSAWYRVLQGLGAAAALAWCLWQQRRGGSGKWLATGALAMGLAWLMLFGPAVEHATYVFLTPVLAWAWLQRAAWPRGRWLVTLAMVLILVLGWGAVTRALLPVVPAALAALPLGTSLFIVWLLGASVHRGESAFDDESGEWKGYVFQEAAPARKAGRPEGAA